ncbi:hypothetical protein IFM89_023163 [Coptis chinensis]|uniref:PGG domain-containing protein n=1 Tax=Coptis chinensis TaxID=261450 RepID=A0A835IQC5_9MAGN|nr:hypothetical protein IFM89_023163 [Coptis chinensis]
MCYHYKAEREEVVRVALVDVGNEAKVGEEEVAGGNEEAKVGEEVVDDYKCNNEAKYSAKDVNCWFALSISKDGYLVRSNDLEMDRINTLVLMATLIVTITFAAGFTLPRGHNNDDADKDEATLLLKSTFHIFVISNTIAMYSSIVAAIMLIWVHLGDLNLLDFALRWSMVLLSIALTMLAVTFISLECIWW